MERMFSLVLFVVFLLAAPIVRADTLVSSDITSDTTWTAEESPYIVQIPGASEFNEVPLVVHVGATLSIEPGVVIQFHEYNGLYVEGTLRALGTAESPIFFTSMLGGFGGAEQWMHLSFGGGSSGEFAHAIVEYGGQSVVFAPMTAVFNDGGTLSLDHVIMHDNGFDGYVQNDGSAIITNSDIRNHSIGVRLGGGVLTIIDTRIRNNEEMGISLEDGLLTIAHAEIVDNGTGIAAEDEGTITMGNSSLHGNSIGVENEGDALIDARNNWWGSTTGPTHPDNFGGAGDVIEGVVTYMPFLTSDPFVAAPPVLTNLGQFRQFGIDEIAEGTTFIGNTAVFKADITDTDSARVQLEIEVKPVSEPFDGSDIVASEFAAPGELSVALAELIPITEHYQQGGNQKSFHWRARAVDEEGNESEWQEFGSDQFTPDFTAKVVPLWTQVGSDFPVDSIDWEDESYASGTSQSCGEENDSFRATIGSCGCLIASAIMLARYYDLEQGIDGNPITPLTMNVWLQQNGGYSGNLLNWSKAQQYLGKMEGGTPHSWFELETVPGGEGGRTHRIADKSVLDDFLAGGAPFFGYDARVGHYLLVDAKLSRPSDVPTYTLRDPFWYETETLDEPTAVPQRVRRYSNTFSYGTVLTKLPEPRIVAAHTELFLASPAELLVIDPEGRRTGKDPATGAVYNEIPEARYYMEDSIHTSEEELDPADIHQTKVLELPILADGAYDVRVIGTDTGSYTLTSAMTDESGSTTVETFTASTTLNEVAEYELVVADGNPHDISPAQPDVPALIAELKMAIKDSDAQSLAKIALLIQVGILERVYEKERERGAKALVIALEREVQVFQKKNKISDVDAEVILTILAQLKNAL